MKYRILILILTLLWPGTTFAQETDSDPPRPFVKGGVYDKPYLFKLATGKATFGGYAEVHFRFEKEEGVVEERTFEPKRFNLFFYSAVSDRFRMASELEFEEGTEEILLELAVLDFEIHPSFTFRGGMIPPPWANSIWPTTALPTRLPTRPLVSTQIIPTALSEPASGADR